METGRIYMSATGQRVRDDGKLRLGTVDGKTRGLNMRVVGSRKSLTSVYDMCSAGHRVVFDMPLHGADLSSAENKGRTETTTLKLRNRVWKFELKMIPKAETESRSHVGSSRGPGWAQVESHLAQPGLVLCGLSV